MILSATAVLAGIGVLALSWAAMAPLLVMAGLGMGTLSGCINPVSVAQVDNDHAGAASGLLKTSQQLGGALGIALAGSVYFTARGSIGAPPSLVTSGVIAALLALCVITALRLPERIFAAPQPAHS